MSPTNHLGAHYHAREGKRWRPRQLTLWLGFAVDTHAIEVKIDPPKRKQGMTLCEASIGPDPAARGISAAVSYLNFLRLVALG